MSKMESDESSYWPGGWLEVCSSLCAFSGVLVSLLIIIISSNPVFVVMAIFDMLVAIGIILANYWKKPSWYLPFFIFNGLNIVMLAIAAITTLAVALLGLVETQKAFCDYLNVLAGGAGQNLLSFLSSYKRDVLTNSFIQTVCWLVVLTVSLMFRIISHAITYRSCILLKEEKKQLGCHSVNVEIVV